MGISFFAGCRGVSTNEILLDLKATGPLVQLAIRDIFLKVNLTTHPILGEVKEEWNYISTPKNFFMI
jgi:hypothetical protein